MNDRELLELAAKAAGIKYKWEQEGYVCGDFDIVPEGWGRCWNPLTDDADAFRLAVKLQMRITHDDNNVVYAESYFNDDYCYACSMITDNANDATRRVIVRAAAEIGRSMK